MGTENLPEPPTNDAYARCILAEHSQHIEYWYVGDKENDVIAGAKDLLYRHDHPYRRIANKIGDLAFSSMVAYGRAMTGLPPEAQLTDTPPLS